MINRKIVDHISDINLPYTEHSRRYLLDEGMDGKTIFVTGSPMREVLERHKKGIEASILYASTKSIGDKAYGSMILKVSNSYEVKSAIKFLKNIE